MRSSNGGRSSWDKTPASWLKSVALDIARQMSARRAGGGNGTRPGRTRRVPAPLMAEALELRVMLSGYTFNSISLPPQYPNGQTPLSQLARDGSGDLFGTTWEGGAYGDGTVFKVTAGATSPTTLVSFNGTNGAYPVYDSVTVDANGNLFGTTNSGGASGDGTVFEIQAGTAIITTLANFNGANGANPRCTVAVDSSDDVFGTTDDGGASSDGTIFEIKAGTITNLATFTGTNGSTPEGTLALDSSGDLFGTTEGYNSSTYSDGTVFELKAGSTIISTLASFNGGNGANPYGGVILDGSGNIFGTTEAGGSSNEGTVFEIKAGTFTTLASFTGSNGELPYAGVTLDPSGDLFGTAAAGGTSGDGTVFEIGSGTTSITTLASFTGSNGNGPEAAVTLDGAGDIFGTTYSGGTGGSGAVFEIASGTTSITPLASFSSGNVGVGPEGGFAVDASGDVFGTTMSGGASNDGTVFEAASGSTSITTLASFSGTNGQNPEAALTIDAGGNLFGTTEGGGANGDGTVFELQSGSSSVTDVANFNGTNGDSPSTPVILDSSGNIFGTATEGGASGIGTVFEIKSGTSSITALASFTSTTGEDPYGGLTRDAGGNLFGTTSQGGSSNGGTVFEIKSGTSTISKVAGFTSSTGEYPYAGLTLDASGNLFGTTYSGGSGYGTVFEIKSGTSTITKVASFTSTTGENPEASVIFDSSGNLFGTTTDGGASGYGTVFEIKSGTTTITALTSFNGDNGASPYANLTLAPDGDLYGSAYEGGDAGSGTVFVLSPITATVTDNAGGSSITHSTGTTVPGTNAVYTVVVSNPGPFAASSVAVSDPLPTGVTSFTWSGDGNTNVSGPINDTIASLAPGGSITYTVTGTISPSATGSLSNTATVSVTGTNSANNTATDTDTLKPQNDVAVTVADNDGGSSTGPSTGTAAPGTNITYTIVVSNSGPSTASSVTVSDPLPAGVTSFTWSGNGKTNQSGAISNTITSLAPGGSVTYTVVAAISLSAGGLLSNTATVSAPNDTNSANNTATDSDSLTPRNDVAVSVADNDGGSSITPSTGTAVPGANVTYTITVSNSGPNTATNVAVNDPLPASVTSFIWSGNGHSNVSGAVSDTIASLAPGGPVTYTVVAAIAPSATGSLSNTATASAANDTNSANNTATDSDNLIPPAPPTASTTDLTGDYGIGQTIPLTLTFGTPVVVTGMPGLALNDGAVASYTGGSGANALTFDYTVAPGDQTPALAATALVLGTGTIQTAGGYVYGTSLTSGTLNNTIQVDGIAPTVTGISPSTTTGTVGSPVNYTINFSEPVTGATAANFNNVAGTAPITIGAISGVGTSTLMIPVTPTGLGTIALGVNGSAPQITDAAGNPLTPSTVTDINTVSVPEMPSLIVNATQDVVNPYDNQTSLREAVEYADTLPTPAAITFASNVAGQTFTLTQGPLDLNNTTALVTVDGGSAGVTIDGGNATTLFTVEGTATLDHVTLQNGNAGPGNDMSTGGAIYSTGSLTVLNSTIVNNTAGAFGGAIFINGGTLNLDQSTVAYNALSGNGADGGGVCVTNGATANLVGDTLTYNSAGAGSNLALFGGKATMFDSILADPITNAATPGTSKDFVNIFGSLGSANHNIVDDGSVTASKATNAKPLLGALGNYGGPTSVFPLLPGSPAIDAGTLATTPTPPATDQRGDPRVVNGAIDIGSFESQGFQITVNGGSSQGSFLGTQFQAPFSVTVSSADGEPVIGGTVTFAGPSTSSSLSAPVTATIQSGGVASAYAYAGATPGDYAITASAGGAASQTLTGLSNDQVLFASGPYSYDGTPHTGIASIAPGDAQTLINYSQGATPLGSNPPTDAGTYTVAVTLANGGGETESQQFTISPAEVTPSVTVLSKTYDQTEAASTIYELSGLAGVDAGLVTATGTAIFASADAGTNIPVSVTGITLSGPSAGNYTVNATANTTGTITPAPLTDAITANNKVYDGTTAATATITLGGILPGDQVSAIGTAAFASPDAGNSIPVTDTNIILSGNQAQDYTLDNSAPSTTADITPAQAVITVPGYAVTYDGTAHTSAGSATGVGGVSLAADLALAGTVHINAGTYSDTWSFTDPTGNFASATGSVTDTIKQATAVITVPGYAVTYDGTAHSSAGTAAGVGGVNLAADLALAGTTHINAGTYSDTWSFTDPTGNYGSASGSVTDTIKQATAVITVPGYTVSYDGAAHTSTGTAAGVGGVDLSGDLALGGTAHTNAGTYSDSWTFTDPGGNYASTSGSVTDTINKANATVVVTPYTVTYNGAAHTATVTSITGVHGETGATVGSVALNTTHTNAGTYSDSWSFTGSANYNSIASTAITDIINKAVLSVTGNSYTLVYGQPVPTLGGTVTGNTVTADGITFTYSTTYSAASPVGSYAVVPAMHDPNSRLSNYTFTNANGTIAVGTAATAVSLAAPAAPSYYGQSVALTATVAVQAPGSGTPVGSVQFYDNGNVLGSPVTLSGGVASLTTAALPMGADAITAVFTPAAGADGHIDFAASSTGSSITQSVGVGLLLLDSSGSGALTVSGAAKVVATGTSVVVDSSSSTAIDVSGSASVSDSLTDVAGKASITGAGKVSSLQTGQAAVADPLASLAVPSTTGMTVRSTATLSIGGSTVITLQPGLYIGGINIGGAAKVTLAPGVYYFQGGGFTVGGSATVTGTGVMLYNAPAKSTDQINVSGAASLTLTAATTGTYAGMTIFQARTATAQLVVSGSGKVNVTGTVYAAAALVNISGAAAIDTFGTSLIADDLLVTGSGELVV
jgi:uncharacterized repeat protein (TIGR01451 family)